MHLVHSATQSHQAVESTGSPSARCFHSLVVPAHLTRLHRDHASLVDHLEKHFMCDEALDALRFAHPFLHDVGEFSSSRSLICALRCPASDERSLAVQRSYARIAKDTLDEAHALQWIVNLRDRVTIGLSSSGMLAVVQKGVLCTMFFAGFETRETRRNRLGRQGTERGVLARESAWTADESHFERVFKPAVQLIRSMPDDRVVGAHSQYGALNRVLPESRRMKLTHWLQYRADARAAAQEGTV